MLLLRIVSKSWPLSRKKDPPCPRRNLSLLLFQISRRAPFLFERGILHPVLLFTKEPFLRQQLWWILGGGPYVYIHMCICKPPVLLIRIGSESLLEYSPAHLGNPGSLTRSSDPLYSYSETLQTGLDTVTTSMRTGIVERPLATSTLFTLLANTC